MTLIAISHQSFPGAAYRRMSLPNCATDRRFAFRKWNPIIRPAGANASCPWSKRPSRLAPPRIAIAPPSPSETQGRRIQTIHPRKTAWPQMTRPVGRKHEQQITPLQTRKSSIHALKRVRLPRPLPAPRAKWRLPPCQRRHLHQR